jgi:hypothetical protein
MKQEMKLDLENGKKFVNRIKINISQKNRCKILINILEFWIWGPLNLI